MASQLPLFHRLPHDTLVSQPMRLPAVSGLCAHAAWCSRSGNGSLTQQLRWSDSIAPCLQASVARVPRSVDRRRCAPVCMVLPTGQEARAVNSFKTAEVKPRPSFLSRICFQGDVADVGPVDLKDVSLAELLSQVGAGEPRNAGGGQVQIESNPHPSVLKRYTDLSVPDERGRALPIPTPHKLQRPLPLPRSRRLLRDSLPSNMVRRNLTSSSKQPIPVYPKLLAKLLITPNDELWTALDSWNGKSRSSNAGLANVILEIGRAGFIRKALQVFAWIRKQPHLWPDEHIVLIVIQVAVEARDLALAKNLTAFYGPLSSKSSLVLANIYVEHGLLKNGMELLLSLEKEGISCSRELYVKTIVKAGQIGATLVVRALLARYKFKLQLEDCTKVMATCSKLGLDEEVEDLFQHYRDWGYKPNIVMFTTLMKARSRAGKLREAVSLFWEMEAAGIKPDLIACQVMIGLCDELGDLGKGVKVFNQMKATGLLPTSDVYNVLIRLYCREGRSAKAREVMQEMKLWGCGPTSQTREYLSGFSRSK